AGSWPGWATVSGLVAVAVLVGVDARVDTRAPVPGATAVLVASALVVGRHDRVVAAAVVAVTATATAWTLARTARWWPPILAALAVSLVVDARPSRSAALAGALAFALFAATRPPVVAWTAPFVCVGLSLAAAWRAIGACGAVAFTLGILVTAALAAVYGALPW